MPDGPTTLPDDPDVIRKQMEETRSSLAEKLETLEQTVAETVTAATDTVASVRDAVQETVDSVKGTVQDTVQTVTGSVRDTVDSVKDSLDLSAQVQRHPWLCLGGAMAVGYLGGRWLLRSERDRRRPAATISGYAAMSPGPVPTPTRGNGRHDTLASEGIERTAPPARPAQKSWLQFLGEKYAGELNQLKGLALGATMGIVRDAVVRAAPEPLQHQLADVINGLTTKLGGDTIAGPILEPESHPQHEPAPAAQAACAGRWPE
jgi:ElaB/YqjD/DUF883 family membrane-anchored ribosome-binding protein